MKKESLTKRTKGKAPAKAKKKGVTTKGKPTTKTTPAKTKTAKKRAATPASPPALPIEPKMTSVPVAQPPATDMATISTRKTRGPIGVVTHYYSHLNVAVVQLFAGALQIGDIIHIKGHTTDLIQTIDSMEAEHQSIDRAVMGQLFGIKVRDHVREHDQVFKISN